MAKQKITYEPQILDLILYAGDGISFTITVTDPALEPIDLTGTMIAQIRTERESVDPPNAEFEIDLADAELGIAVLKLTGEQTHSLITPEKFTGVWDLQWTPAGEEPMTLCQGSVECRPDVSH
jgi:hypothetical protein